MARRDRRLAGLSRELEGLAGRLSALARDAEDSPPLPLSPALVRLVLGLRLMWSDRFAPGLGEPARNMLLALYAARLEAKALTPTALAAASALPSTTAHRWLARLAERKLVLRAPDPADRRLVRLTLSPEAAAAVEAYLAAIFERQFLLP